MPLNLASVHGIKIHRPKDLGQIASRIVFGLETRFPRAFYAGKKLAIRTLMRVKQRRREKAGIVT